MAHPTRFILARSSPQNDPLRVEQLLADSGIVPQTTVIAYGSYPGTSSWIFCFLRLVGHDNVRVLNGGHSKWMAEGHSVVADLSPIPPRPSHETSENACLIARSH
ncbi:rhodanese-like domain-containing protein [Leptolyngbya sp. CCNP1308]|uniref:rhodanese-like domain-containing protein n=1 Tax=Leptolyngbya sp. CCNP1308 TaxID=3110255 RepID=UPI003A5995D8